MAPCKFIDLKTMEQIIVAKMQKQKTIFLAEDCRFEASLYVKLFSNQFSLSSFTFIFATFESDQTQTAMRVSFLLSDQLSQVFLPISRLLTNQTIHISTTEQAGHCFDFLSSVNTSDPWDAIMTCFWWPLSTADNILALRFESELMACSSCTLGEETWSRRSSFNN